MLTIKSEHRPSGQSVGDFVVEQIFSKLYPWESGQPMAIEAQPTRVAGAIGRLLEVLLEKGLLNMDDVHRIADTRYNKRDYTLVKEEE